jgi:hypothetical protein
MMRIRHPVSFFLLVIVMVGTAALSVVWSFAHMIAVVVVLGLQVAVRVVAFREGTSERQPPHGATGARRHGIPIRRDASVDGAWR